jgi:hypothetical protein
MDEQLEQMVIFEAELTLFTRNLQAELESLAKCNDQVVPYWQDSMRQKYDSIWLPFHEQMVDYLKREAPAYLTFLHKKIQHLREYLHG